MVVEYYNKSILLWGIERAGFQLDEFLKIESRVNDWIQDIKQPTVKQLEEIAKKIHLPFGYLFLDNPPKEEVNFPFFRSNEKNGITKHVSLNVYDTIQIIQSRQDWLKEYLLEGHNDPLPFVGKFDSSNNPTQIAADIRNVLHLNELWASQFSTWENALNHLTVSIEDAGIIVTFNGVVGNNTKRKIPVDECRGFVLVDDIVPFMFINNSDSKAAQVFTIAHELAHIWIGFSAGFDFRDMSPANDDTERLCDRIAAEFLVPEYIFKDKWNKSQDFQTLSRFFKVSPIVVARRALDLGYVSKKGFFEFYNEYLQNEYYVKSNSSGGDFYLTAKKRISPTFAIYVNSAVKSGRLLYRDAYRLTGIGGDTFSTFIKSL